MFTVISVSVIALDSNAALATSPNEGEENFGDLPITPTSTHSSSPSPSPGLANHSKVSANIFDLCFTVLLELNHLLSKFFTILFCFTLKITQSVLLKLKWKV